MSIPTTETKPDGIYRASKPQVRYVREMVQNAGPSEIRLFIDNLIKRSKVERRYFAQLGLGLLLLLIGILAKLPLLVLIAAITSPVLNPIIGMVAAGARPSGKHMLKSLLYLLATLALFFGIGWIAHFFNPTLSNTIPTLQPLIGGNGWFEWLILVFISVITVFLFLYRENIPSVVTSTILVYLVFLPVTLAGLFLAQGDTAQMETYLLLAGARLFVSLFILIVSTWLAGFSPKQAFGWLLFALTLTGAVLLINEMRGQTPVSAQPTPEPDLVVEAIVSTPQPTPIPTEEPERTLAPTEIPLIVATATNHPTPTPAPEVEEPTTPVVQQAEVVSESGVVVRESPGTNALILAYLNNGQVVSLLGEQETNQDILWEKVELTDGLIGWATSRYLQPIEN